MAVAVHEDVADHHRATLLAAQPARGVDEADVEGCGDFLDGREHAGGVLVVDAGLAGGDVVAVLGQAVGHDLLGVGAVADDDRLDPVGPQRLHHEG
jgi:hypothetical protein